MTRPPREQADDPFTDTFLEQRDDIGAPFAVLPPHDLADSPVALCRSARAVLAGRAAIDQLGPEQAAVTDALADQVALPGEARELDQARRRRPVGLRPAALAGALQLALILELGEDFAQHSALAAFHFQAPGNIGFGGRVRIFLQEIKDRLSIWKTHEAGYRGVRCGMRGENLSRVNQKTAELMCDQ
jgi:hypothetical protein